MRSGAWCIGVVLALLVWIRPLPAAAQCAGMMGGGHPQHASAESRGDRSARKDQQAARRLLSRDSGRAALVDAILADRDFMRSLFARAAASPEWRPRMIAELERSRAAGIDTAAAAPPRPAREDAAVYACPMHPEVISDRPGRCPKCGMELERKRS